MSTLPTSDGDFIGEEASKKGWPKLGPEIWGIGGGLLEHRRIGSPKDTELSILDLGPGVSVAEFSLEWGKSNAFMALSFKDDLLDGEPWRSSEFLGLNLCRLADVVDSTNSISSSESESMTMTSCSVNERSTAFSLPFFAILLALDLSFDVVVMAFGLLKKSCRVRLGAVISALRARFDLAEGMFFSQELNRRLKLSDIDAVVQVWWQE